MTKLFEGQLITCGPFKHVRNPFYLFQTLTFLGITFSLPILLPVEYILLFSFLLVNYLTIREEEKVSLKNFGKKYSRYARKTNKYLPFFAVLDTLINIMQSKC